MHSDEEEAKIMTAGDGEQGAVAYEPDVQLQTRRITPDVLAYLVGKIVHAIGPRQVIVFGSQASGTAGEASDLDLFVVNDGPLSNRQLRRVIERLMVGRQFGVDLVVRRPEEVARNLADGNPFYTRHIFGEGRVVYERAA
jgi:predicted nucleotidyltransferase